jgi:tRNA (Thr-GGU) A37 N-methylase
LEDLADFDRIWLIYNFHRAAVAKMSVVPYRDTVERGLFSTRVPARPNPIGMSCVRLLNIEGNILRLAEVDILDDTPLLDIKPYVPQYDNYSVQRCGWLDTVPDKPVVADDRFERKDFQSSSEIYPTQTNHRITNNIADAL